MGGITYPEPDPLSGVEVLIAVGDPGQPGECGRVVLVWNGRSRMLVDGCTGKPREMSVEAEDAEAFDRLLAAIEVQP